MLLCNSLKAEIAVDMGEFNEDLNGKIYVIIELLIMGYIIVPTGLIHIVYDEGIKLISSDG